MLKPDYSNTKIYKLVSHITGDCYIGHTPQKYLSGKLNSHKQMWKLYKQGKLKVCYSYFQIFESGFYYMELIENYPCKNFFEARTREEYYQSIIPCLNPPRKDGKDYIDCLCGSKIKKYVIAEHIKTKKHQAILN